MPNQKGVVSLIEVMHADENLVKTRKQKRKRKLNQHDPLLRPSNHWAAVGKKAT